MLSIAYGGDQSRAMQVHRPEVCYVSQGFQVGSLSKDFIDTSGAKVPVMKLIAKQGSRIEPITYWVMIGDSAVRGNLEQGFARLKYGLTGKIPDGLLFRVSSIQADEAKAYQAQDTFTRDLLRAMSPSGRQRIIGNPSPAN